MTGASTSHSSFAFLIYQPPLILLITPSCFIVFLSCFAFPLFHYNGSLHISHPAHLSQAIHLHISPSSPLTVTFPKARFSAHFFSIFTPLLFTLSLMLLLSLTSYMLRKHNSSFSLFIHTFNYLTLIPLKRIHSHWSPSANL